MRTCRAVGATLPRISRPCWKRRAASARLAERVGVSEALLYKIVAGTKTADGALGERIAASLECRLACSLNSASGTIPTHSRRNEDGSWGRIAGHDWPEPARRDGGVSDEGSTAGHGADPTMTVPELARRVGIDASTAYRYLRAGQLPGVHVGSNWLIDRERVERFMAGREDAAGRPLIDAPAVDVRR